ncbi:MAG: AMP-binding protein, partial [Bacteroidales bacterium]|nr:AMP-binding protein [Candidatus Colimorpha onthohippi]
NMNYVSLFKQSVAKWPQRVALVDRDGERNTTYAELDSLSGKVANKLRLIGIGKGDFVLVNMGRCREYVVAYIGVLKAGGVVVPVVPDYPDDRIAYIRSDCGSRLTITLDFFADIDGYNPYECPSEGSDPALLAYTSGTTGNPKGILFSTADMARTAIRHECIFANVEPLIYGAAALFSFMLHVVELPSLLAVGGTIHILEDRVRKSAVLLAVYYEKHRLTIGTITPQMLRLFHNSDAALRRIITCGERLSQVAPGAYELVNCYGMSETVGFVTTFAVAHSYDNTPIGKSMPGVDVIVCDEKQDEVEAGNEGEICVVGEFDTVYFNDSERNKSVFRRMPDGRLLIRTGDIGYVNADGDIVYTNRRDWMVKVNGQRVETLEIEARLMDIDSIENAAVKAFEDADGQTYLVAYYVAQNAVEQSALRDELTKTLPEYMIPRFMVQMDELPRNANGKLDRKALMPPAAGRYKSAYRAPSDALEKDLCDAFEEVLHCGTVGVDDDFFALGGDSIKVLHLLTHFDAYNLDTDTIFKARTPKAIAKLCRVSSGEKLSHGDKMPDFCPLSDSQLGIYLDSGTGLELMKYNIPVCCLLPDNIDLNRFKRAAQEVCNSHKTLKVVITDHQGEIGMRPMDKTIDVVCIDTDDIDRCVRGLIKPFSLQEGPLCRFYLLHSPCGNAFFFDIHHIVFDGSSIQVLLNHIATVYEGGVCPDEDLDIFDIAASERIKHTSEAYRISQDYFKEIFDGIDCDATPISDRILDDGEQGAGHVAQDSGSIDYETVSHFVKTNGITQNTLFMAAFAYTLAKLNGASDCYFCTVNNGRHDVRLSNSIGMFVRTLPLYFEIDEGVRVSEYLSKAQQKLFDTMRHDEISFSELASQYGLGMSVSFVYQGDMFEGVRIDGEQVQVQVMETPEIQSDVHFMLYRVGEGYRLEVGYRKKLYTEGFIARWVGMFFHVVKGLMSERTLEEISLADEAACDAIRDFNHTEEAYDTEVTVVDLFRRQAAATPDADCVVYKDHRYTYAQVDSMTDALAGHLITLGMSTGAVVGILIPRCEYMLIASLGVLKAGCAYLPLDPTYPED